MTASHKFKDAVLSEIVWIEKRTCQQKVPDIKFLAFPAVMYGCGELDHRLGAKELMLSNCGAGELHYEVSSRKMNHGEIKFPTVSRPSASFGKI